MSPPNPSDALAATLCAEGTHAVSDGYCVTECSYGLSSDRCGLEVVRPGKVQCWCDHECPGVGVLHEQGICAGPHHATGTDGATHG